MNKVEPVSERIKMDLPEMVWVKGGEGVFPAGTVLTKPTDDAATIWGASKKAVANLHKDEGDIMSVLLDEARWLTRAYGYSVGIIYNEDLIEIARFTV
jgi:hypothetical protein